MKGIDTIIASVLVILISITAVILVMQSGNPAVQKSKEILLMQRGRAT